MAKNMVIKWFQCEYTLLHRRASQRRGAKLGNGQINGFAAFARADLILMEVSELDGIVRIIVKSACK